MEDGALSHARKRLGIEVFRRIFEKMVAYQAALPKDFYGLTSVAFDGTGATMPDTPSNRERFGRPHGGRGAGGYPQLRAGRAPAVAITHGGRYRLRSLQGQRQRGKKPHENNH